MPELHILVDSSGSMQINDSATMKWVNSIIGQLALFNNTPHVSLGTFDYRFKDIHSDTSADKILPWTTFWPEGGSTNTHIAAAREYKSAAKRKDRRHLMLILTDGLASDLRVQQSTRPALVSEICALFSDPNWSVRIALLDPGNYITAEQAVLSDQQPKHHVWRLPNLDNVETFNERIMEWFVSEIDKDVVR